VRQLLSLTIGSLVLSGCPQVLSDDFHIRAAGSVDAGMSEDAGLGKGGASTAMGGMQTTQAGTALTGGAQLAGGTNGIPAAGGSPSSAAGGKPAGGIPASGGGTNSGTSGGGTSVGGTLTVSEDVCTWGRPEQITGLGITDDMWGPTLSSLATVMYFSVRRGTTESIYRSERSSQAAEFGAATLHTIGGVPSSAATPFLSDDATRLYFVAASGPPNQDRDLWVASRSAHGVNFTNAQALAVVNSRSDEIRPWLSKDELTLLFASNRPGGAGDFDIWSATRRSIDVDFDPPVRLEVINDTGRDEAPVMTDDQLTLYFASIRTGGAGQQDIYVATRASPSSTFSLPVRVEALSSVSVETDLALTPDEAELFFVSDSLGVAQIWSATRTCE